MMRGMRRAHRDLCQRQRRRYAPCIHHHRRDDCESLVTAHEHFAVRRTGGGKGVEICVLHSDAIVEVMYYVATALLCLYA